MTASLPSANTVVRQATPADLADVARLLSARDQQLRNPANVDAYLWHLDPAYTCTWLAYVGERPAGITMVYLRDMVWPSDARSEILRAGYWSHLFVEPEFRRQMIYPQLVLSMLRGMASEGISIIYTATRQPDVAEGHQKLGFALAGKLPLRLRPLRPFRLITKHKNIKLPNLIIKALDTVTHRFIRRKATANVPIAEIPLADPRIDQIVSLLNFRGENKVRHVWTTDEFRRRFATTLDGTPYRILGVVRDERVVAAIVTVLIERGNNITAGAVLALVADKNAVEADVTTLLAEAEAFAHTHQAELMLALDDSLGLQQLTHSGQNYLSTNSETYHLLVYPKKFAQAPYAAVDLKNWIFDYADHDAF